MKEQWGKLTDDDLTFIAGKRDQLEGKIQERYGIQRDAARNRSTTGRDPNLVTYVWRPPARI